MGRDEVIAAIEADKDDAKASGIREERRRSWAMIAIALVAFAGLILAGLSYARSEARAAARDANYAQQSSQVSEQLAEQEAEQQDSAAKLQAFLDQQAEAGQPVSADQLKAAIAGVDTGDPALKAALSALAEQIDQIEKQAGPPGPSGPSGEPYTGPPPSDGVDGKDGSDGQDGVDGKTPSISFSLVNGVLYVTINGSQSSLGSVVGPPGPPGPQGVGLVDMQCVDGTWVGTYYNPATGETTYKNAGSCQVQTETVTAEPAEEAPPSDEATPTA